MITVLPVTPDALASVEHTTSPFGVTRDSFLEFVNPASSKYTYKRRDPEKSSPSLMFLLVQVRNGQSRVFLRNIPEGGLSVHNLMMAIAER